MNDNFSDAFILSGLSDTDTGSNVGFTGEVGEPFQSGTINSAWWSWTAPVSGEFVIDTNGSDFDTFLSVFTGDAVDDLITVDQDDDGGIGLQSLVQFTASEGTTYHFAVDGFAGSQGDIAINLDEVEFPLNDDFNNSLTLEGLVDSDTGTNQFATQETGEPFQSGAINSVWWSWTAPVSGEFTVDTDGSNFDTFLSVFTGNSVDDLTTVDQDDDGGIGLQSLIEFTATEGTTYHFAVDGFASAQGDVVINLMTEDPQTIIDSNQSNILEGGNGGDFIDGQDGRDTITGNGGDDTILGGRGRDLIDGGEGADTLNGGFGRDTINGGEGDDDILGGNDADILRGGLGNDTIESGSGRDIIVLAPGEGTDTITDFNLGSSSDRIGLTDGLTFADLSFAGNSINFGAETLANLDGVDTTTLIERNFVLI